MSADYMRSQCLSGKELEILTLVSQGDTNKEIARKLHISPVTVKYHIVGIFIKSNTRNRTEAVAWAFRSGILP